MHFSYTKRRYDVTDITILDAAIDYLTSTRLLGIPISADINDKNISGTVQNLYYKANSVLYDFKYVSSDVKSRLLSTYCLDAYGSNLEVNVAWRKIIRKA